MLFLAALQAACTSESKAPSTPAPGGAPSATGPIAEMDAFIAAQKIDKTGAWKTHLPKPPKLVFDAKTYYWVIKTNKGEIKVKLLPSVAPMHVSSTIYLARLGFYDGLLFHRVLQGFMAQGGDPTGSGSGSPGYAYDGEFDPKVRHDRPGLLSMANTGYPGTDGSQFFLTFDQAPHLNGKHTIFGEVVAGMDTVKALERCAGPPPTGVPPKETLRMESTKIVVE